MCYIRVVRTNTFVENGDFKFMIHFFVLDGATAYISRRAITFSLEDGGHSLNDHIDHRNFSVCKLTKHQVLYTDFYLF